MKTVIFPLQYAVWTTKYGIKEVLGARGMVSGQFDYVDEFRASSIKVIHGGIASSLSRLQNREIIPLPIITDFLREGRYSLPTLFKEENVPGNPFAAVATLVNAGLNLFGFKDDLRWKPEILDSSLLNALAHEFQAEEAVIVYSVAYAYLMERVTQQVYPQRVETTAYVGRCVLCGARYRIPGGQIIQSAEVATVKQANYAASINPFKSWQKGIPENLEDYLKLAEGAGQEAVSKLLKKLMI